MKSKFYLVKGEEMKTLYYIRGTAYPDEYRENLTVLEYEETPKLYVGNGQKINKKKIGKISESLLEGSYETYIDDEAKISEARERIKNQVYIYHKEIYEKEKSVMNTLDNHSLNCNIRRNEY